MIVDKAKLAGVNVHFIGVGGCGMSGLAIAASELGACVSGSDIRDGVFTASLRSRGLEVSIGHSEKNIPNNGIVVYSSAISRSNPERAAAEQSVSIKLMHRSGFLELLSRGRLTVAVAGSHGKTTTSTMLAHVLMCCGLDASYVVGGLPNPPMKHSHVGQSNIFIFEADESDRSLLNYRPDTLIVTNVDLDHAGDGNFRTVEDTAEVFREISARSQSTLASAAAGQYLSDLKGLTACDYSKMQDGYYLSDGIRFRPSPPGDHQAQNIALVIGCSLKLGCKREDVAAAIHSFPGLHRRFNKLGTLESGAVLIDDYAHHPTEIRATLKAMENSGRRIVAVFQPHRFTRTRDLKDQFGKCFDIADHLVVTDIYSADEKPIEGVSGRDICESAKNYGHKDAHFISKGDIIKHLIDIVKPGDAVFLLGAGDIGELPFKIAKIFESSSLSVKI